MRIHNLIERVKHATNLTHQRFMKFVNNTEHEAAIRKMELELQGLCIGATAECTYRKGLRNYKGTVLVLNNAINRLLDKHDVLNSTQVFVHRDNTLVNVPIKNIVKMEKLEMFHNAGDIANIFFGSKHVDQWLVYGVSNAKVFGSRNQFVMQYGLIADQGLTSEEELTTVKKQLLDGEVQFSEVTLKMLLIVASCNGAIRGNNYTKTMTHSLYPNHLLFSFIDTPELEFIIPLKTNQK